MKIRNQILLVVIVLSGLMPLYAGYLSFSDPNKALEMFKIVPMPGMDMIVVLLGICFLAFAILYLFCAYLLYKRRQTGTQLAIVLGFVSIMSGLIMYMKYKQLLIEGGSALAYVDMAKGAVIMLLGYMAKE